MLKKKNLQNNNRLCILKILLKLIPTVVTAAPVLFFVNIAFAVLHGVSWGILTMVQQRFFDETTLLVSNETTLSKVLTSLVILGVAYIINEIVNGVDNYIPNAIEQKINGKLSLEIHNKVARLYPIDFEDTNKLDDINKAEQGKNNSVSFSLLFINIFTFYLPYFIFMGWYLFMQKPILAVSIILVFIPTAATQIIRTNVFTALEDESAPVRREYDYYENCITSREYYKETRILGGFFFFKKLYLDALDMLQKLKYKATMKTNLIELSMRLIGIFGYFAILYMLFYSLINKEITVGVFAAVFNSIGMLYEMMEEVVYDDIGNMAKNIGTIKNYLNFLDMEERTGEIDTTPEWGDVVLQNVSFSYPNTEKKAVNNASFTISKGETIAVVGENGSGKSTIIRLVMGLYLPIEGKVTMNGVDTKCLTSNALYKGTSAVFQKYQRYQMTLEDNIIISQRCRDYDKITIDNICEMAGVDKDSSSFIDGYNTMLSREFDGVDLSGGQWQRIAIARGFFRSHNLIILDEPTAAIDPYEETRIYNRFAEIAKGKTAIIVTHRLGSVKLADKIIVMKNGEIGTHYELIRAGNEYTRLYMSQEQWYLE